MSAICNATAPIDGALISCVYRHGHAGPCSWYAHRLTDDQLRAECLRRSIDTMTPEMTKAWANDRAAYIRSREDAADMADRAIVDRDEWKRRAEKAEAFLSSDGSFRHGAEKWMARAKALEDGLADRLATAIDSVTQRAACPIAPLRMPECGDIVELRGIRHVCIASDFVDPHYPLLKFCRSEVAK